VPRVLPSQIVEAINQLFGARNEIYSNDLSSKYSVEVEALLSLTDDVPGDLIDLNFQDYLEFQRCCAALTITLAFWKFGNGVTAPSVGSATETADLAEGSCVNNVRRRGTRARSHCRFALAETTDELELLSALVEIVGGPPHGQGLRLRTSACARCLNYA
jgi:hypothetical protein